MKTRHYLYFLIGLLLCGMANAAELKKVPPTDAWRTSLSAFVKKVDAIAQKSEITDASVAIKRIREFTVFSNDQKEELWVVFKQGFGNEFHGELAKQFSGQVSWRGVVDSVETDGTEKVHIIKVKFPVTNGGPKRFTFSDWFRLVIPISKLKAAKLPTKGDEFVFRGKLKKEKDDALFEPVNVLYGLGPNAGKVVVGVDLVDVVPSDDK
jgi:hypothetical protein